MPYKALTGLLASRGNHSASDVGGPITQAMAFAALPTKEKFKQLEAKSQVRVVYVCAHT